MRPGRNRLSTAKIRVCAGRRIRRSRPYDAGVTGSNPVPPTLRIRRLIGVFVLLGEIDDLPIALSAHSGRAQVGLEAFARPGGRAALDRDHAELSHL